MFRNPTADVIVVLVIVLLIFGPKRLPGLGKPLGTGIREFKDGDHGETTRTTSSRASRSSPQNTTAPAAAPPVTPHETATRPKSRRQSAARSDALGAARRCRRSSGPSAHEDRLSVIDHLDELRTRLIICGARARWSRSGSASGRTSALLRALNRALPQRPATSPEPHLAALTGDLGQRAQGPAADRPSAPGSWRTRRLSPRPTAPLHAQVAARSHRGRQGAAARQTAKKLPITIGVGEPFTTTLTVAAYFALLFALPVLLYEAVRVRDPGAEPARRNGSRCR